MKLWLFEKGFCIEQLPDGFPGRILRVINNIYDVYDLDKLRTFVSNYVSTNAPDDFDAVSRNNHLIDAFFASGLPLRQINAVRDTATMVYLPYKNGMGSVTAGEVKITPYDPMDGLIARSAIIDRNYVSGVSPIGSDFDRFLELIMNRNKDRKDAFCSVFAYLISRHKNRATTKAIILTDASREVE